ncbi:hypothetical protein [Sulfurimonas sp. HSL-1716]|uniref:hypothetical protein n=1 Tax=Hydrocurvibacter sulfurireducens TaxID=3131937 RepID=UPI0031F75786
MKKTISLLLFTELFVLASNLISYKFFLNAQIAFLSAFFILLGSMYSYKRLVEKRVEAGAYGDDDRDEIDKIDDPYDLYDENEDAVLETKDIKAVIKEEKKRLKANGFKNTKIASGATISLFRIIPYVFLVFGFIGLQNNQNLLLFPYLLFLLAGVAVGFFTGRKLFLSSL